VRSPADMDLLMVESSNRCFLSCSNCTRAVAHQTETREITPEQFRQALRNLDGWYQPGRAVGLIGGEPTLNRRFRELCEVFKEEWNPGQDTTHGRAPIPIAEFDRFASERLFDRGNGRGLWTSFGPKFREYYEDIMDCMSLWNPNDHSEGTGLHQTGMVDAREMMDALGLPWEDFPKYRDNCWVQNTWSASITPKGNYFCEFAGQLDLLYNDGKRAWKDEPGWWKRTPDQFGDQLEICEMCSLCLPGPSQRDALERDIISENHRKRLEVIGSPAVKKGRYELYDSAKHLEQRMIDRKDNYVAPSGRRVAADNPHLLPLNVAAVVTCVGRAEQLRHTLLWNVGQVDKVYVVTTSTDDATRRLVLGHPDAELVVSDRCFEGGDAFNKGKLINDGLRAVHAPDWVVLTDADVLLNRDLKAFLATHALNPGVLYGATRFDVQPGDVVDWLAGRPVNLAFAGKANAEPNGYFQMFNRRASAVRDRWPAVMAETFCSAGGIDTWFLQQFAGGKRHVIPGVPVTHIAHADGEVIGAGWNGGGAGGPRWRQFGMLQGRNLIKVGPWPDPPPTRVRLTDTATGQSCEAAVGATGDLPQAVLAFEEDGRTTFMGRDVGGAHIHMAYWG
jgi:hypothetical protein